VYDSEETTYLYVVSWKTSGDVVKVGRSNNPSRRFNDFLTAHHEELNVHCICDELIMSEANVHQRFRSAQITLEHHHYTKDLKDLVEMLNMSTKFKPYTIPRTQSQTGIIETCPLVDQLKATIAIPPLRISPMEKEVAILQAIGATVAESAAVLDLTESCIKSHRAGVLQKCFTPNNSSALVKLFAHDIISTRDLK